MGGNNPLIIEDVANIDAAVHLTPPQSAFTLPLDKAVPARDAFGKKNRVRREMHFWRGAG